MNITNNTLDPTVDPTLTPIQTCQHLKELSKNNTYYNPWDETNIIGIWISTCVCIIGCILSIITIIIIHRAFRKLAMWVVMQAVSVCNIFFLVCYFVSNCLVNVHHVLGYNEAIYSVRGTVQRYSWTLTMAWQLCSYHLMALVSIERYMAVCHPFPV